MKFLKHLILRDMVFKMKWMMRIVPSIARPIVQYVADHEVIACGLREEGIEGVSFIYSPGNRGAHSLCSKSDNWREIETKKEADFSNGLVKRVSNNSVQVGEVYQVRTGNLKSPDIEIKRETKVVNDSLDVEIEDDGEVEFEWEDLKSWDIMIYFLVVEDVETGMAQFGVYTPELEWEFAEYHKASLSIGNKPSELEKGKEYRAKLLCVDYDGWVSHMATQTFTM